MTRHAHLLQIHPAGPDGRALVHAVEGTRITVGRDPGNQIIVDAPMVDPFHVRIERLRGTDHLRIFDLQTSKGTRVEGWPVEDKGMECRPGSVIALGAALLVYRPLTDDEALDAALPPLPGPLNTRHGPLVASLRRIQRMAGDGGPIWLSGPAGIGRSVVVEHMRALAGQAMSGNWIIPTALDFRTCEEPPAGADPQRTIVLPAIADRLEDLLVLIRALCGAQQPKAEPTLLEALHLYDWPGNVRELRVMLERAQHPRYGSMPGSVWGLESFPDIKIYLENRPRPPRPGVLPDRPAPQRADLPLPPHLDGRILRQHLHDHRWRLHDAAAALDINRATLLTAIAHCGLRGPADLLPRDWMPTP